MKKKTAKIILLLLLLVDIVFIVLDIANVSNYLSFIQNLNCEWTAIIINCSVVIVLYLFTFIFVDDNAKKKEKNQKDACAVLLKNIYENCLNGVRLFDEKKFVISAVAKCNFNVPQYQDEFFMHLQNYPFDYENQLFQYINSGILLKNEFEIYLAIKSKYKDFINLRITFFDVDENNDEHSEEMSQIIQNKRKELIDLLTIEIKKTR